MSMYNMVKGMNLATFYVLPVLGKHPEKYPRFRDCFVRQNRIVVLTRTGGNNRFEFEEENKELEKMAGFVKTHDDKFDNTFAYFEYEIPKQWVKDVELVLQGKFRETSDAYKELFVQTFPKLASLQPWDKQPFPESLAAMVYKDNQTPFDDWPGRAEMEAEEKAKKKEDFGAN